MAEKPHDPKAHPQADHPRDHEAPAHPQPAAEAKAKVAAQLDAAIGKGLAQLDASIRTQLQLAGPPGSGLYTLLDNLAVSTLGCSRTSYPTDTPQGNAPPATQSGSSSAAPRSDPNFGPGVPGTSPPGPLPGAGRGQAPNAASSAPLGPNA